MKKNILGFLFMIVFISAAWTEDVDEVYVASEVPAEHVYESPTPTDPSKVYFHEHFDNVEEFEKKWVRSLAKKDDFEEEIAKYDGEWKVEGAQKDAVYGDLGLVLKTKAKHAAISASLIKPFTFTDKPLIVQYEVLLQEGQECGGSYLKLLSQGAEKDLKQFTDKTPYSIMFGPDKCGNDYKLHFIFKHRNPLNGTVTEKHCTKPKERLEEIYDDKLPHLYTLIINPDNTFEIRIDRNVVHSGSLLEDFAPPVNPDKEINDPNDKKPEDWDEREKIPDPTAEKPADWDEDAPPQIIDENALIPEGWLEAEPTNIPDPNAKKPEDWDTEMDGEWEAPLIENPVCAQAPGCGPWEPPLINNPAFKGKWRAPTVDNPNYKGKWIPRRIQNPDYFEDLEPFKMTPVSAIGFELWSMSKDLLFDNLIIADDMEVAAQWAAETFDVKRTKIARDSVTFWRRMMKAMNYRPKTWGLYFIWCSIPVCIYMWYLYTCVKEESVVQRVANFTVDNPWIWGVYIVILAIPVVFVLYCCFKPSSSSSQEEKEEARQSTERKKTDEPKDDDVEQNIEEGEEEEEDEEDDEDEDAEKVSNPESEEDNEAVPEEAPAKSGEGTRKRKARKD